VNVMKSESSSWIIVLLFLFPTGSFASAVSCPDVFAESNSRVSLSVSYRYEPTQPLDAAASSPMGYQMLLPFGSLPAVVAEGIAHNYPLRALGVVNTGVQAPFRASSTLWGSYNGLIFIKTAKHVADKGVLFFKMGGLSSDGGVVFDMKKNRGKKIFDDPDTDVAVFAFARSQFSDSEIALLEFAPPLFKSLGDLMKEDVNSEMIVAGRVSMPAALADSAKFPSLFGEGTAAKYSQALPEATLPGNLDSRSTGAQGDVFAIARTSLINGESTRIPDPDGLAPAAGGSGGPSQAPFLPSALITQVFALDYRSVGRLSGASVFYRNQDKVVRPRDVLTHITKGLPQPFSTADFEHPNGTWKEETDANGHTTGKYSLMTPAPFAYASDYSKFGHNLETYIRTKGSSLPVSDRRALLELLRVGQKN
jgi:hypothetical protein